MSADDNSALGALFTSPEPAEPDASAYTGGIETTLDGNHDSGLFTFVPEKPKVSQEEPDSNLDSLAGILDPSGQIGSVTESVAPEDPPMSGRWTPPPVPVRDATEVASTVELLATPPPSPPPSAGLTHTPAEHTTGVQQTPPSYAEEPSYRPAGGLDQSMEAAMDRRFSDSERLWPVVDQVLAVASSDPILQAKAAGLEFTRDLNEDAAQRETLFEALKPRLAGAGVQITDPRDVAPILQMAYDELLGISVLGDLWRDDDVTEIMVDRWDHIVVERKGILENTRVKFRDAEHANSVARALALRVSDRAVSRTIPLVTAELPKARVTFAYGAVVKGGLSITIRKFKDLMGLDRLLSLGSLNQGMVDFLTDVVEARSGVLVSGGTGTGKTTIINMLSSFIPDTERVITIEDAFELQLSNTHVVSLQTKEASSKDDTVEVSLADLLRNTLRMRPDRIIVGEIREGEGAIVMLAAANTGHDGTMTTLHASSADMAVNERLVDLARQVRANSDDTSIRRSILNAFDIVVQVSRGKHGRRYLSEISVLSHISDNGAIVLDPVFFAEPHPDGTVTYQFRGIKPGTVLAGRLEEKGTLDRWLKQQS